MYELMPDPPKYDQDWLNAGEDAYTYMARCLLNAQLDRLKASAVRWIPPSLEGK